MISSCLALLACGLLGGLAPSQSLSKSPHPADRLPPPQFRDVAKEWGLEANGSRVVLGDLNGDGWLDAIVDTERVFLQDAELAQGATAGLRFVDFGPCGLDRDPSRTTHGGDPEASTPRKADFIVLGDVDNDGDLDVFSGIRAELEFWKRDPDKTGEPLRDDQGKRVPSKPDSGFRSRIYLNDGHGKFLPAPESDLSQAAESSTCATFVDYDLDGILDLFVGSWYVSYGWSLDAYPDRLYRGLGDGRFDDVTEQAGLLTERAAGTRQSSKPTYGVAAADWDLDGDQDLFVCGYGRRWNLHWRNLGDGRFEEIGESTAFDGDVVRSGHYPSAVRRSPEKPFRSNGNTFDVALADFDHDGDVDAFLADITHWWAGSSSDRSQLLVNRGRDEAFRFDRTEALALPRTHAADRWNQGDISAAWVDVDGDGWLDLALGSSDYPDDQRLRIFRNENGQRFEDKTIDWAIDWVGAAQFSVGDIDRDGDPDFLMGRSLARLKKEARDALGSDVGLLVNESERGPWLTLELVGSGAGSTKGKGGANRQGIGARVEIQIGDRRLVRIVQGGAGHGGRQDPAPILLGLRPPSSVGQNESYKITVHWPNSARSTTEHEIAPNPKHAHVRLHESGTTVPVSR